MTNAPSLQLSTTMAVFEDVHGCCYEVMHLMLREAGVQYDWLW